MKGKGDSSPALNGIELRNLCTCRILPKVCSPWKATPVIAIRQVVTGGPESKAHSRYTLRRQSNQ